jgi:protein-tyrosine phosphatase
METPQITIGPRRLNLRDVGGHRTRTGRVVARNRLFRSAAVSSLGQVAAAELTSVLGISRVIDLRREVELGAGADVAPCERVHLPLFESIRPDWDQPPFDRPATTGRRYFEMLQDGRVSLSRILDLLGECSSRPTLVHCHAGRDRTGIVIACVLDLLDVPDDAIAADYALSSVVDEPKGRRADPESIRHLFTSIRAEHGSIRQMVLSAGVHESTLERLALALLE